MKSDVWFWIALPLFVLASGNFTPFRLGPITPVSLLVVVYVVFNIRTLLAVVTTSYLLFGALVLLNLYEGLAIFRLLIENISVDVDFTGAPPYPIYSIMFFARMIISVLFLAIIVEKTPYLGRWAIFSMWAILGTLFAQIVVQAALYHLAALELGYTFGAGLRARFGGLFGEPQTISAYLFCTSYVLYTHYFPKGLPLALKSFVLLCIMAISLLLTTSSAWILAFGLFVFLRAPLQLRAVMVVGALLLLLTPNVPIIHKIVGEYAVISERSVTVIAGMQVFLSDPLNWVFGYGPGMSPYLIQGAEIFQQYPQLNLAELGRQNVMNSYAELVFECGVVFAALYFFVYLHVANLRAFSTILLATPILIGVFSIGGGLYSGYMLFGLAALGIELKRLGSSPGQTSRADDLPFGTPIASGA